MLFRYAAAILLTLFGACLCSYVLSERARRVSHYRGVCALLEAIREGIERYLAPLGEILSGFRDKSLSECGFLESIRDGRGEGDFSLLALPEGDRVRLREFFSAFGSGYAEAELRAAEEALEFFKDKKIKAEEVCPKDKKITLTLFAGFVGGVFLLLI